MLRKGLLVFTLLGAAFYGRAQQVLVRGGFTQDSLAIGQPVGYYLTARYPETVTVLFPDSTFSFAPFEYISKRYYPTRSAKGTSYDSVVYQLRTFEINRLQWLSLPVFIPSATDSLRFEPRQDTLRLISLATVLPPDTIPLHQLPLKSNTDYKVVQFLFNYPLVALGIGSLLLMTLLGWVFFGKRIRKYFTIRRLEREYWHFVQSFKQYQNELNSQFRASLAEQALSFWKKYLEKLEQKPYTKLTTREVLIVESDPALGQALSAMDGAIYGNLKQVNEPMAKLSEIATHRFQRKMNTIKNG